jgi:hypothetical protein
MGSLLIVLVLVVVLDWVAGGSQFDGQRQREEVAQMGLMGPTGLMWETRGVQQLAVCS